MNDEGGPQTLNPSPHLRELLSKISNSDPAGIAAIAKNLCQAEDATLESLDGVLPVQDIQPGWFDYLSFDDFSFAGDIGGEFWGEPSERILTS